MRAFLCAAVCLVAQVSILPVRADDPVPPKPEDDAHRCVIMQTLSGWSRVDDLTLILRGGGKKYKVDFYSPCRETNWAFAMRAENSSMCLRPGDTLIFEIDSNPMERRWRQSNHHGFEERCQIKSIELLPPNP